MKEVQRERDSLRSKLSQLEAGNILDKVKEVKGVKVLAEQVDVADMNQLRGMVDDLKQKLESGVILLAATAEGKGTAHGWCLQRPDWTRSACW